MEKKDCDYARDCEDFNSSKCDRCKHNKRKSYYEPKDSIWTNPWKPDTWTITSTNDIPCKFDSLPPGIYGLVCNCPKCSPRYLI